MSIFTHTPYSEENRHHHSQKLTVSENADFWCEKLFSGSSQTSQNTNLHQKNTPKHTKMIQNDQKWPKMAIFDPKMTKNDPKWPFLTKKHPKWPKSAIFDPKTAKIAVFRTKMRWKSRKSGNSQISGFENHQKCQIIEFMGIFLYWQISQIIARPPPMTLQAHNRTIWQWTPF